MKRHVIYIGLLLMFIAGNVYQGLNPRVEIKEKIVEVEKVVTVVKTNVKTVIVERPDGTKVTTMIDLTTTETDSDIFRETDKQTKPMPLPLNSIYIGINPLITTDLEIVYGRRVFGALSIYASGSMDLTEFKPVAHIGLGIQF